MKRCNLSLNWTKHTVNSLYGDPFGVANFVCVSVNLSSNKSCCKIQWNAFISVLKECFFWLILQEKANNILNFNQIINTDLTEEMVQWVLFQDRKEHAVCDFVYS